MGIDSPHAFRSRLMHIYGIFVMAEARELYSEDWEEIHKYETHLRLILYKMKRRSRLSISVCCRAIRENAIIKDYNKRCIDLVRVQLFRFNSI